MHPKPTWPGIRSFCTPERIFTQALGEYLNGYAWDHFATLTYARSRRRCIIEHDIERSWFRICARKAQRPLAWFYAIERGAAGRFHVHALLAGTALLSRDQVSAAWKYGRADIRPYDRLRGASWYCTKDTAQAGASWDVSRRVPPQFGVSSS
jgi:hypothetical protein